MKRFTTTLRNIGILCGCMLLMSSVANAATFTAVASGKFTSTTTWGGTAPLTTILSDIIVIPPGITVDLDQDVELQGALSSFTVNGALNTSNNSDLTITSGTLLGGGMITVDELMMTANSGINYTGSITAETFTSSGATINSAASITVNNTLNLMSSATTMAAGTLKIASGGTIVVSGGSLAVSGGAVDLTSNYHVRYMTSSATAGLELSGSGLMNIEVDVPSGSSVQLSSDLDVKGMLTLTSGALDLNGNSLTFTGNGDLSASGSGMIMAMIGSVSSPDITINTTNGLSGKLMFSSSANSVNNFTINLGTASERVTLGSDLHIAGTLNLQAGIIDVDNNTLTIDAGGTVTGGSSGSFVSTGNGGMLMMNVNAGGSAMFQIGTETKYAPAMVTANTGSATGMYGVSAHNSVYLDGSATGDLVSDTEPVVNATWDVTSSATSNINLNLDIMWSADMEVNNFDRTKAYISHNMSGTWDVQASTAATMAAGGMYKISRANITTLSPFTVAGEGANLAVNGLNNITAGVSVYPNPAIDRITFKSGTKIDKVVIYDVSGRTVLTTTTDNTSNTTTISLTELNSGIYYAHFLSGQASTVRKFVKR